MSEVGKKRGGKIVFIVRWITEENTGVIKIKLKYGGVGMCKKYQKYRISVTYENLLEELIEYNYINKSINNYNYKDMLKVYKDFKETCAKDVIQIDFMGVSSVGEIGIIFTKDCKVKPKHTVAESTDSLITEAKEIIKVISDKQKYHSSMVAIFDKKGKC